MDDTELEFKIKIDNLIQNIEDCIAEVKDNPLNLSSIYDMEGLVDELSDTANEWNYYISDLD